MSDEPPVFRTTPKEVSTTMPTKSEIIGALGALIRRIKVTEDVADLRGGSIMGNAENVYRLARDHNVRPVPWTPLREVPHGAVTEQQIADAIRTTGYSEAEVREIFRRIVAEETLWVNDIYQVNHRKTGGDGGVHLSIKRLDQEPIHDWRDLQRIKDQLIGPECEAVELYPATSRLVDTSNQYHLFGFTDPAFRFPFGFDERMVSYDDDGSHHQRPEDVA